MKSFQKMTPPCTFCKDKLHATLQCKSLMEALKKNPNPKPPSLKEKGQGGNGAGRRPNRGKCSDRGSGGGQQNQQDSKKGRTDSQQKPKN